MSITGVRGVAILDDRHTQFLIVVADACSGAALGRLLVEVLTIDGMRYCGVPTAIQVEVPDADRGTLHLDGSVVAYRTSSNS